MASTNCSLLVTNVEWEKIQITFGNLSLYILHHAHMLLLNLNKLPYDCFVCFSILVRCTRNKIGQTCPSIHHCEFFDSVEQNMLREWKQKHGEIFTDYELKCMMVKNENNEKPLFLICGKVLLHCLNCYFIYLLFCMHWNSWSFFSISGAGFKSHAYIKSI